MPKLLWVALPLLALGAWLGWRAWRRRWPARPQLNALLSLLLLAYLATTAALGVFWVANQQLPVFDWHYLFGYLTVVLVLLHLGFNARVAWRALRGPRGSGHAPDPGRRRWLAGLGLTGLAGLAYWLGLRQADRVWVPSAAVEFPGASGPGPMPDGWTLVQQFHAASSHGRSGLLRRSASAGWGEAPSAFKPLQAGPLIELPPSGAGMDASPGAGLTLHALGRLLWHTAGISARRGELLLRTSPSSGGLFSTELYLLAPGHAGLAAGAWHYRADGDRLQRIGPMPGVLPGLPPGLLPGWPLPAADGVAPVLLVATAVWRRTGHKYRDRCYRYVLADLGHALENLQQAAAALGLRARLQPAFDEQALAAALGLDQAEEGVLMLALLEAAGASPAVERPPGPPPGSAAARQVWQPAPLPTQARLGLTESLHAASSLRAVEPPAGLPPAASAPGPGPARGAGAWPVPPAAGLPAGAALLALIAGRRSRRRFGARPLRVDELARLLRALPGEGPGLSAAVQADLVLHQVQGLAPGAWHFDTARGELQPRPRPEPGGVAALRARLRAAALDQDVIGEAAAVLVLWVDPAALQRDAAGPARGYRHALLEAGRSGERLYLAAEALGLAVCAVGAFYDEEAAALLGRDPARTWVLHFAGVGPRPD